MAPKADPRTLDEIITENAILWLLRRVAARRIEKDEYTVNHLANEMIPFMVPAQELAAPGHDPITDRDRIRHSLRLFLGVGGREKQPWRVDYLDAFCKALRIRFHSLLVLNPELSEDERQLIESMKRHATWLTWSSGKKHH